MTNEANTQKDCDTLRRAGQERPELEHLVEDGLHTVVPQNAEGYSVLTRWITVDRRAALDLEGMR